MMTLVKLAIAAVSKIPLSRIAAIFGAVEAAVTALTTSTRSDGQPMSGVEKMEIVFDRVVSLVPGNRHQIAEQLIRAIVEIVLIGIRISSVVAKR